MVQRAAGVCRSYPDEADRQIDATYSQYMQVAGKPDRQAKLAAIVDQGLTTDESRAAVKVVDGTNRHRYLLCVDVSYFVNRFWHSGSGVESASGVASWVKRTVERLREKGLTDVACCLDSSSNHRKLLTAEWEDKYKGMRGPKDPELIHQLNLVQELLASDGFACVTVEGYEADDVMASYSRQFDGKVTLLSQDKDLRSCLSDKCNMLLDVEWKEDEHSGDHTPEYKWLSAKLHTEATGITPDKWVQFQTLRGDPGDGIRGCEGVGEKGAKDLVLTFGSAAAAIEAARLGDPRIKPKQQAALIEFAEKLDVTLKLVTLVDSLQLPSATRI
jgi:DNA polymerase-1